MWMAKIIQIYTIAIFQKSDWHGSDCTSLVSTILSSCGNHHGCNQVDTIADNPDYFLRWRTRILSIQVTTVITLASLACLSTRGFYAKITIQDC